MIGRARRKHAREHRYDLYDLFLEMPAPLVPRHLRLEVDERVYADGSIARAPNAHAVARLVAELRDKGLSEEEVQRLRRENQSLKADREVLKKSIAFFVKGL